MVLARVSNFTLATRDARESLSPSSARWSGHSVGPVLSLGTVPPHYSRWSLLPRGSYWSYLSSLTSGSGATKRSDVTLASFVALGARRSNFSLDTVLPWVSLGAGHSGQTPDARQAVTTGGS